MILCEGQQKVKVMSIFASSYLSTLLSSNLYADTNIKKKLIEYHGTPTINVNKMDES